MIMFVLNAGINKMVKDCYVKFDETPFYYGKEKSGLKNNFLIKTVVGDERFGVLYSFMQGLFRKNQKLFIVLTKIGGVDGFVREVSDVSYFDGYYLITWGLKK